MKSVLELEPTVKDGALRARIEVSMDRSPHGVVEATPTAPPEVAKYAEPEDVIAVVEAYGNTDARRVEVEVRVPARKMLPCTARAVVGVDVQIPTKPRLVMVKSVEVEKLLVEEEMTKAVEPVMVVEARYMEKSA